MLLKFYFLIVIKIRELPTPEKNPADERSYLSMQTYIQMNPATSASVERSFSRASPKIENMVSLNNDTRAICQLDNIKQS